MANKEELLICQQYPTWELWLWRGRYFRAELYSDGVCQVFTSDADSVKRSGVLFGFNTDDRSDAIQKVIALCAERYP